MAAPKKEEQQMWGENREKIDERRGKMRELPVGGVFHPFWPSSPSFSSPPHPNIPAAFTLAGWATGFGELGVPRTDGGSASVHAGKWGIDSRHLGDQNARVRSVCNAWSVEVRVPWSYLYREKDAFSRWKGVNATSIKETVFFLMLDFYEILLVQWFWIQRAIFFNFFFNYLLQRQITYECLDDLQLIRNSS